MNDSRREKPAELQETEPPEHPKEKIIHFSSGETLEVEDSEEEEEEPQRCPFQEPATRLTFKKMAVVLGRMSLLTCDFLGKKFAAVLGLNVAKYQYAIDQYHRHQKETGSQAEEGPAESVQLSCLPAGGRYGATRGRHNRGYKEDEHVSK